MIHRNIEISLNLRRVQIQRQHTAGAGCLQQIRNQLRRNRDPWPVLTILPCIRVIRNHRRDPPCRGPLERINHQQQLHQIEIDGRAARLHHKHIRAAHIFQNLIPRLAVAELPVLRLAQRYAHELANGFGQRQIRSTAEDLEFVVGQNFPLSGLRPAR